MDEQLVRGNDVDRIFGAGASAVEAVVGATFCVEPGTRVAIVGPSGSGKSTLIRLMAALDRPTSGTISWPALGGPDDLRPGPVSVAFQGHSLLPPLNVLENVALPNLLAGEPEAKAFAQATDLLDRLELAEVGEKLPEEISGGQAQRAAVARALVGEPRVVLADEPTGQQDRAFARLVMDVLLASTRESGAALVVATHDPAVAGRLDTRWEMTSGRLRTGVSP